MKHPGVHLDDEQLIAIIKALSDPNRFEILRNVGAARETPTCSCIRDWTGLSPATVSHHVRELENAGLVSVERCGKFAYITLRRDVWKACLRSLSQI